MDFSTEVWQGPLSTEVPSSLVTLACVDRKWTSQVSKGGRKRSTPEKLEVGEEASRIIVGQKHGIKYLSITQNEEEKFKGEKKNQIMAWHLIQTWNPQDLEIPS